MSTPEAILTKEFQFKWLDACNLVIQAKVTQSLGPSATAKKTLTTARAVWQNKSADKQQALQQNKIDRNARVVEKT